MKRCAVLVALLIVAGSAARANPVGLSDSQLRRLAHGEVVVLDVLPPGGSRDLGQGGSRGEGVLLTYAMAARTMLPQFLTRVAERDGLVETVRAVRERAEQSH